MKLARVYGLIAALLLSATALLAGCPDVDVDKKVQETVKVPGLDEAVLARDKAIAAAIKMSWASDVELMQEQLAVEDVHAGRVRITGIVSRDELKERAETIAGEMEGVNGMVSTITVDPSLVDKRLNLNEI